MGWVPAPDRRVTRAINSPTGRRGTRRTLVAAAAGTLGVAALTGLLTQTGAVDTSGVRWIHHGLYAASIATCALAALVDVIGPGRRPAGMVPSLVALGALGRTRGGTTRHGVVATLAVAGAGVHLARSR